MNPCPKCGYDNGPNVRFCAGCGSPMGGRRRKKRKVLVVIVAVVLAAALALGGGLWYVSAQPASRLLRAAEKTADALGDYLGQPDNLRAFYNNFSQRAEKEKFSLRLSLKKWTEAISLDVNVADDAAQGVLTYRYGRPEGEVSLEFYEGGALLQLAMPQYLKDVYGMPTDNLREDLENSALGRQLGLTLPDIPFTMDCREELDALVRTLEVAQTGEQMLRLGDEHRICTVYGMTWDKDALAALVNAFLDQAMVSSGIDYRVTPADVAEVSLQFYVDGHGYLVGVDILLEDETCAIRLAGPENPWQVVRLGSDCGDGHMYTDLVLLLDVDEDRLTCSAQDEHGREGFRFDYDDRGGAYLLYNNGDTVSGYLRGDDGKSELEVGDVFILTLAPLEEKPRKLAEEYRNILDMTMGDWQELFLTLRDAMNENPGERDTSPSGVYHTGKE